MARTASPNQLKYLKALAERTGTSFTMTPGMTMAQASAEINRMQELSGISSKEVVSPAATDQQRKAVDGLMLAANRSLAAIGDTEHSNAPSAQDGFSIETPNGGHRSSSAANPSLVPHIAQRKHFDAHQVSCEVWLGDRRTDEAMKQEFRIAPSGDIWSSGYGDDEAAQAFLRDVPRLIGSGRLVGVLASMDVTARINGYTYAETLASRAVASGPGKPVELAAGQYDPLEAPHHELVELIEQQSRDSAESEGHRHPRAESYSTARFDDAKGYGSQASYRGPERDATDAPELTDAQERAIIDLQASTEDEQAQSTVVEAADYLDHANARQERPPSERQLDYLHALETKLGLKESTPGSSLGASRRIERYNSQLEPGKPATETQLTRLRELEQELGAKPIAPDSAAGAGRLLERYEERLEERHQAPAGDEDLAATLALSGAASPHSITDVAAAADGELAVEDPSYVAAAREAVADELTTGR